MQVKVIPPDPDGFCPALQPGECCRDAHHGVWHFRAPDGARFAAGGKDAKTQVRVREGAPQSFHTHPPEYAHHRGGVVENRWTLCAGEWAEVPPEAA